MKKMKFVGLALLAPLTLLCACSDVIPLSMSANWYADSTTDLVAGATETLVYDVTYEKPATNVNNFGIEYDKGTYTTEFTTTSEPYALSDGSKVIVYCYKTTLNIPVRYTFGEEKSETFNDVVTTETYFHGKAGEGKTYHSFAPVYSKMTMDSTLIKSTSPEALDQVYAKANLTRETWYDTAMTKATVKRTTVQDGTPSETQVEVEFDEDLGTYFDNDQLLFALRGVDVSAALTFSSIDPQADAVSTVKVAAGEAVEYDLNNVTIGGNAVTQKVSAYKTSVVYDKTMAGTNRTLYYAAKTSGSSNVYRNVLLKMETPIMYNMGTLHYTLTSANFA